jgi:hypothetical protein
MFALFKIVRSGAPKADYCWTVTINWRYCKSGQAIWWG